VDHDGAEVPVHLVSGGHEAVDGGDALGEVRRLPTTALERMLDIRIIHHEPDIEQFR